MSCSAEEFRIQQDAIKDPAEPLKVSINCYDMCVLRWQPNEPYSAGDFFRPRVPNGFSYEVTVSGVSGHTEPRYPTTIGGTVVNGSMTITCRAAGSNGLNAISAPTAVSEPTGLTISAVSVSEIYKILATYSGGTVDLDYDVVFTFTLDGVSRVARQTVKVRKR
jgi:hypothetical protein